MLNVKDPVSNPTNPLGRIFLSFFFFFSFYPARAAKSHLRRHGRQRGGGEAAWERVRVGQGSHLHTSTQYTGATRVLEGS